MNKVMMDTGYSVTLQLCHNICAFEKSGRGIYISDSRMQGSKTMDVFSVFSTLSNVLLLYDLK